MLLFFPVTIVFRVVLSLWLCMKIKSRSIASLGATTKGVVPLLKVLSARMDVIDSKWENNKDIYTGDAEPEVSKVDGGCEMGDIKRYEYHFVMSVHFLSH